MVAGGIVHDDQKKTVAPSKGSFGGERLVAV